MNTHPVIVQYKGSTVVITLDLSINVADITEMKFTCVAFGSNSVLFAGELDDGIEEAAAKKVVVTIPEAVTAEAESDVYNFLYEIKTADGTFRSKVEKAIKFEDYSV